jgi:hypothetical protein
LDTEIAILVPKKYYFGSNGNPALYKNHAFGTMGNSLVKFKPERDPIPPERRQVKKWRQCVLPLFVCVWFAGTANR